ncbi:MAG: TIGR03936 family radical SAM-associated protein [Dehalococcoidia bacterium]
MKRSSLSGNQTQQRIRLSFSRGDEVKYISHLDLMRLWHRALRRAGMPLAYSQGYNPQPRIAIAAPLAVGVTSEAELVDIFMERKVSSSFFERMVGEQLPDGVSILNVRDVWPRLPSLQSRLRFAEYRVVIESQTARENLEQAIGELKSKTSLPWRHSRGEKVHEYDLRELIDDIWVVDEREGALVLGMRLRNDSRGSGRPDQVLLALGCSSPARSIHRTKLITETGT